MAYVVHFLALEPGTHWVDALEAQEREQARNGARLGDRLADIVRTDWWRIASMMRRMLPDVELRRTRAGLTFVDRSSGLVLDLEHAEIALSLPFRPDESRALAELSLARRLAAIIEEETGLVAFDVQLGEPFLGSDVTLASAAALMALTHRALAGTCPHEAADGPQRAVTTRPSLRS